MISNQKFKEYLYTNILDSIFFKPTDDVEIQDKHYNSLKNYYSECHEVLSVNAIKTVATTYRNLFV